MNKFFALMLCLNIACALSLKAQESDSSPIITVKLITASSSHSFHADLSATGRYIIAHEEAYRTEEYLGSQLRVWDVADMEHIRELTGNETNLVTNVPSKMRQYVIAPEGAIAGDDHYFSVHLPEEVRIYTLPELKFYRSFFMPELSISAWSLEGRYLGILARDNLMVMDIEGNQHYMYPTARYQFTRIFAAEDGWLLLDHEDNDGTDFVYCDLLLTDCQSYATENTRFDMTTISPDGTMVITQNGLTHALIVWAFQPNQQYQIIQEIIPHTLVCPSRLNPIGTLLYLGCSETIVETSTFTVVHEMPRSQFVDDWLSDRYFLSSWVTEGNVFLHDMEHDTMTQIFHPYETDLVDLNALFSMGDLPQYAFEQELVPDKQGKRFLLNMYFALFLFEIEPSPVN